MDNMMLIIQLIIIFLLIIASAFFSSSETALMSSNQLRLKKTAEEGKVGAKKAVKLLEDTSGLLTTILVGNNIVNVAVATLSTSVAIALYGPVHGPLISSVLITIVLVIFGEIMPKTIASKKSESLSAVVSGPITGIKTVLKPIVFLFNKLNGLVIRTLGFDDDQGITEEDIRTLVSAGEEEGILDKIEHKMIYNVFELNDTSVREVMIPRVDIKGIEVESTLEELMEIFQEEGYSRIPVYDRCVDNIVGIIYNKDVLKALWEDKRESVAIKDMMRKPHFVPETKKINDLFQELKKGHLHLAIVIDEYGGTAGMVTLEDLLEEIVGEIRDEYDSDEGDKIEELENGSLLVSGGTPLKDLRPILDINFPGDEYETLNGFILQYFGRIPKEGECLSYKGFELCVKKVNRNRIEKVQITDREKVR